MAATDIIDRYFHDVHRVKELHNDGRMTFDQASTWIAELDDALFSNFAIMPKIEHDLEAYVLIGSRDADL